MARLPDIESEQSKLTTVLRAMSNAKRMRIRTSCRTGGNGRFPSWKG